MGAQPPPPGPHHPAVSCHAAGQAGCRRREVNQSIQVFFKFSLFPSQIVNYLIVNVNFLSLLSVCTLYSTYVILEISSDAGSVKFKTDPDRAVNFFVNKSVFIPASPLIQESTASFFVRINLFRYRYLKIKLMNYKTNLIFVKF